MKLEEAIHQKEFAHEWQKATINLLYSHSWLIHQIKRTLKKHGVTPQQYNVLRILRGQHPAPLTTSVIRDRMLDRMSDASRIVERLHKKGWVIRKVCLADKRLVDIVISGQGIEVLKRIDMERHIIDKAISNLTEGEAQELNRLLDKMRG